MTARRRDSRIAKTPDRPVHPDRPVGGPRTGSGAAASHRRFPFSSSPLYLSILLFFLLLVVSVAVYLTSFGSPSPAPPNPIQSVYERGLVKADVKFHEILRESMRISENRSRRHFLNPVLAYITPWNSKGYEMAKLFSSKFTHLSPVWYELKSEGKKLVLDGRHNADMGWISELRMSGNALVLPRVVLEVVPAELLQKKKQWNKAIDIIITECKDMGYDGIVLESWSRWAAYGILHDPDLRSMGLEFIKRLGQALHSVSSTRNASHHMELVYVIPAPHSQKLAEYDFGPQDLQQLSDFVDGFSLMTYDFPGPHRPGPNAPLSWIRSCLSLLLGSDHESGSRNRAHMVFLGVNFYGNDFMLSEGSGGGAITGGDYLSLLQRQRPVLQWDEKSGEHFFVYSNDNTRHAVFYPSLLSISMRLNEAQAWGAGLSIWEIGQGLDYFFDLL